MTTTYIITAEFAASILEIKNPWFIVAKDGGDFIVGVYEGRAAARAAKATGLAGKVVSLTEIELKTVTAERRDEGDRREVAAPIIVPLTAKPEVALIIKKPEAERLPSGFEKHGLRHCPSCGLHLSNGVGTHGQDVNDKPYLLKHFEFQCLGCGAEFGPAIKGEIASIKPPKNTSGKRNRSNVEKPVTLCWDLFDEMKGGRRKDSIAAAVAKGVTFYTAHSQYQLWFQVQKEMKAREEATAAAKIKK